MATPGMSRSGRVIKKSAKLLEMEDDQSFAKPSPGRPSIPSNKSVVKTGETTAEAADQHLISAIGTISLHQQQQPSVLSGSIVSPRSGNNLKLKLNLSGEAVKVEPTETTTTITKQIAALKMNISPAAGTLANTPSLSTPIKIISSSNKAIQNAVVLKSADTKVIIPKRTLESANLSTSPFTPDAAPAAKKIKVEVTKQSPGETTKPVIASPAVFNAGGAKVTQTAPIQPRKILISQTLNPSKPPEVGKPLNATIAQTSSPTKPRAVNLPQHQQTSTPHASTPKPAGQATTSNTSPSKGPIMSIQDAKRINQRARTLATPQSSSTPAPSRSTTARRAASRRDKEDKDGPDVSGLLTDDDKQKKKPAVSAYVLWCRESRKEMSSRYPDLNFVDLSKKMGEFWHTLAQNEKDIWFKKAKLLTNSSVNPDDLYTQEWISDDLKPKTVSSKQTLPITTETVDTYDENFGNQEAVGHLGGEVHVIGTELIDVQAYLNILGDSLETIGSYLQRGVKYNSDIDYSQSTALSTLLDTALVAMGSLTCLTRAIPRIAPSQENVARTLNDVTLFMPPTKLSYDA